MTQVESCAVSLIPRTSGCDYVCQTELRTSCKNESETVLGSKQNIRINPTIIKSQWTFQKRKQEKHKEQRTGGVLWDAVLGHEAMILLPCSWTHSRCDICTRMIQGQVSLNLSRNQQTILYPQPLPRSYLPRIADRVERVILFWGCGHWKVSHNPMNASYQAHSNSIHWTWNAIGERWEVLEKAYWENMGRIEGGNGEQIRSYFANTYEVLKNKDSRGIEI